VQVGAGDVYYETEINNDYVVRSIPKSGGLPKTIWDVTANPSPNSPRSFTVIEPNLYLVYYTPTFVGTQAASIDTLAVVPISGGTLKTVIAQPPRTNGDPEYFLGPASDGTSLYWVDINAGNNGFILSSLLGGASVSTPLTAMSFAPSAMEFDSTSSVYLGSNNLTATPGQPEEGVLVSTPKAGGGVTTLAATAIPGLFAVNGQNIYWWTVNGAGGAQLQMTPVSGGSTKSLPAPVAGIGPADIAQMLADDDNVYMSVGSPGANPSVYRMPAAGGASVEIATSAFGYLCIAQDAVSIYLASTDVGLWRLAK